MERGATCGWGPGWWGFVGNITVGSHLKKTIGSDLIRLELWEGHFGHGVENQLEGNLS